MTEMLLQFNSLGEKVVVVAATNRIQDIDAALLRRFERKSLSLSLSFSAHSKRSNPTQREGAELNDVNSCCNTDLMHHS
jgi:hypothetical protein